jgi:hypothetical protein
MSKLSNVVHMRLDKNAPTLGWIMNSRFVVDKRGLPKAVEWIKQQVPPQFQQHLIESAVRYSRSRNDK